MTFVRLAVLGDPIDHSRSPDLHRAALAALGLEGDSRALRTPAGTLGDRLRALAAEGLRGVNLTHPLKEEALQHVMRISDDARRARSINTIAFDHDGWWGETTDGLGFIDLIATLGRTDPAREYVVLLGAGGAARSIALALQGAGARGIVVSARRRDAPQAWRDIEGCRFVRWRSADEAAVLGGATLVVNATPLDTAGALPPFSAIDPGALLIDLVYRHTPTPWVQQAREAGREAHDGLGLLVHQAQVGLSRLLDRPVPLEPLARAVGWPR
jgi:shikimate dehydrogenase